MHSCRDLEKYANNLRVFQLFHWGALLQHQGLQGSAPLVKMLLQVLVKVVLEVLAQRWLSETELLNISCEIID